MDVEDAFEYPTRGNDAVKRFLIGGGIPSVLALGFVVVSFLTFLFPLFGLVNLLLFPIGLVVGLLLTGYYVRVARTTYAGSDEPPSFGDWGALARDGGYGYLIGLVYAVPLVVLAAVGIGLLVAVLGGVALNGSGAESAFAAFGALSILVFGVLALAYFAYSLVMGYFAPISVCIYADTGSVRSAFSRERLLAVATEKEYVVAWVAQAGALFAVQSVVGALTTILVGYLLYPLLPFVTFFVSTAAFYAFARVYDDVVGTDRVDDSDPATA